MDQQLMSTPLLDRDGGASAVNLLIPVKPEDLDDADLDVELKKLVYTYMEEPLAHTGETEEGKGRATSCVRTRMHKYTDLAIEIAKLLNGKGSARRGGQMEALALLQGFHRWHMGELPSGKLKPYVEHTKARRLQVALANRRGGRRRGGRHRDRAGSKSRGGIRGGGGGGGIGMNDRTAEEEEETENDVARNCATGGGGNRDGGGGGGGGGHRDRRGDDEDGIAAASNEQEEEGDVEMLPIDVTNDVTTTESVLVDLSTSEESRHTQEPDEVQRSRVYMKEEEEVEASSGEVEAISGAKLTAAGGPVMVTPRPKPSHSVEGHHREPASAVLRGPARHGGKRKKFTPQATIVPQRLKDAYIGWATSGVSRITEGSSMYILDSVAVALSYMAAEGWENKLSANATDLDDIERALRGYLSGRAPKPVVEYLSQRPTCDRIPKGSRQMRADIHDFLKFLSAEAFADARQTQKPPPTAVPLTGCCELDPQTGDDFLEWATCRTPAKAAVVEEHAQAALRDVNQVISKLPAAAVGARVVYKKNALPIWRRHRQLVEPLVVTDETVQESWKLFLCFLDAGQSDMPSEPSFDHVSSADNSEEEQDRAVMGSTGGGGAAATTGTARSFTAAPRTTGLFRSFKRAGHPSSSSPSHTDAAAAEQTPCPLSAPGDSDEDSHIYGVPPDIIDDPQGPSEWLDAASQVVAGIAHDLGTIRQLRQQALDVCTSAVNMQAHLNTLLDDLHTHDAPAAEARAWLAAVGLCRDFSIDEGMRCGMIL